MAETVARASKAPRCSTDDAASSASSSAPPSTTSSAASSVLGAALFGAGRIGSVHINGLCDRSYFDLRYVVDVDLERAELLANQAGGSCKAIADPSVAIADPLVAFVVICSPTATHVSLIEQAAAAGKHIFCEKPVSLHFKEVIAAYKLAREHNVHLYCAYQRRADASFRKLHSAVKSGALGQVQIIKSTSRDHPHPSMNFIKISGGFFHDCASHDLDLLCWVAGCYPHRVFANSHAIDPEIRALGDVDTATISLEFPSGILGLVDVSRFAAYGYDQRLEVHGSEGMAQTQNCLKTSCVLSTQEGITFDNPYHSFPQRYAATYQAELIHFYEIVTKGVTPWVSSADCIAVAQIADAVETSAKTHQPVDLTYIW